MDSPRAHGSYARYVHGPDEHDEPAPCRCEACTKANRERSRMLRYRIVPAFVGAAPVRAHLRFLASEGVGLNQVAKEAGLARSVVSAIVYGCGPSRPPRKRVTRATADAIMAVQPNGIADGAMVDAGPTWARIDSLIEAGWSKKALGRAVTGNEDAVSLQLGRKMVTVKTARRVAELAKESMADDELPEISFPSDLPMIAYGDYDMSWLDRAACRTQKLPTWMFYPGRGDHQTVSAARSVCEACPVAGACLDYALEAGETLGIWGGKSERERRALQRELNLRRRPCRYCGRLFMAQDHQRRFCSVSCARLARSRTVAEHHRRKAVG